MGTFQRQAESKDVYSIYIGQLESYAAYQIIKTEGKNCFYAAINYCKSTLPMLYDLEQAGPLRNHMWKNHGAVFGGWISSRCVPGNYIFLGKMNLIINKISDIYEGEEWPQGGEYLAVKEWEEIPEESRKVYKAYINSHEQVLIGGRNGKYFPKRQEQITEELLKAAGNIEKLDEFPCLSKVELTDITDSLRLYLSGRPMVQTAVFTKMNQSVLDLSQTYLTDLTIYASGLQKLILNDNVRVLRLSGKIETDFHIHMENEGRWLHLEYKKAQEEASDFGLKDLRSLYITFHQIDIRKLRESFPKLKSLYLLGEPGRAEHMEAVGEWADLERLILEDVFGFGESELSALLKLKKLSIINAESISKEAGAYLKKIFEKRVDFFSVKKLRGAEWLQENIDNPFRHWDGSKFVPQEAYKKALAAYRKLKKIWTLGNRQEILQGVREYGKILNKLNRNYDYFIESTERDDIFAAMKGIAVKSEHAEGGDMYVEAEKILEDIREEW